jgi:hypothetical protein
MLGRGFHQRERLRAVERGMNLLEGQLLDVAANGRDHGVVKIGVDEHRLPDRNSR